MLPRSLLIPLDGSRLAERSLVFVEALSGAGQLAVTLISVIDDQDETRSLAPDEFLEREANVLATYLREVATDMEKHLNVRVQSEVLQGSPAELLLARSAQLNSDLMVVSSHGRSGLSRWQVGSVADKLIRGAQCPILVVGPHASDEGGWLETQVREPFERILVPLDGSELSESSLEPAEEYAKQFASEIHLVRIVNPLVFGDAIAMESAYTPTLVDTLTEAATEYLRNASQRISAPGGVRCSVQIGSIATMLEGYIGINDIDLVIMSTHGRGGFSRAALGSVTDRMLGGSAPVLVLRAAK